MHLLRILFLFCLCVPAYGSEFRINNMPIYNPLFQGATVALQGFKVSSGNDDDVAVIQMKDNAIDIKWGKVDCPYNDLGAQRLASGQGIIDCPDVHIGSYEDYCGVIGSAEKEVVWKVGKAKFTQTSLNFKGTFYLCPPLCEELFFQGIKFTKRDGTVYPMIDGVWDSNAPSNMIQRNNVGDGFVVMGCDIQFIFDHAKFIPAS